MPFSIKDPTDAQDICRALYSVDASLRAVVERVNALERRSAMLEDDTGAIKRDVADCHKAIEGFSSSVLGVLMAAQKGLADSVNTRDDERRNDSKTNARIRLALILALVTAGLGMALEKLGYDLKLNTEGISLEKHASKN